MSISFDAHGGVTGSTGCRAFQAGYSVEADRLVIAPVAAVGLPCEGDLRRQDRRFLALLDEAVQWHRDGERLVIVDGADVVLLEASAVQPVPSASAAPTSSPLPSTPASPPA